MDDDPIPPYCPKCKGTGCERRFLSPRCTACEGTGMDLEAHQKAREQVERAATWAAFHRAWTACVGTPKYDKETWKQAEAQMLAAGYTV